MNTSMTQRHFTRMSSPGSGFSRRLHQLNDALRTSTDAINGLRERCEQLESSPQDTARDREYRDVMTQLMTKKMTIEYLKFDLLTSKLKESALQQSDSTDNGRFESVESMLLELSRTEKVFELENEIFDLEMQKVHLEKMQKEEVVDGGPVVPLSPVSKLRSLNLPQPSSWQQQQQLWELLKKPVKHEYVHAMLEDSSSFVCRKIAQYINYNTRRRKSTTTTWSTHRRSPSSEAASFETKSVPELIDALAMYFLAEHAEKAWHIQENSIKLELECYIFPRMYKHLVQLGEMRELDDLTLAKCREFEMVGQAELKMPASLQSPEPVPYAESVDKLRRITEFQTPIEKLYAIFQSAQSVYANVAQYHPDNPLGGDGFMDVWIYIVLKACIPTLYTTMEFIRNNADPQQLQGELGYYFSTLELAASFVKDLDKGQLAPLPPTMSGEPLVVCELEKYKQLHREKPYVSIVKSEVVLRGYRLFAVKEWLFAASHFHSTVAVKTGNPDDQVTGMVLRINKERVTIQQRAFVESLWVHPSTVSGLKLEETSDGSLLTANPADPDLKLTLIPVEMDKNKDDFEAMKQIKLFVTLERLGSGNVRHTAVANFRSSFNLDASMSPDYQVDRICREIQISLQHLGFLSFSTPLEGLISDVTLSAVRRFQKDFNIRESSTVASSSRLTSLLMSNLLDEPSTASSTSASSKTPTPLPTPPPPAIDKPLPALPDPLSSSSSGGRTPPPTRKAPVPQPLALPARGETTKPGGIPIPGAHGSTQRSELTQLSLGTGIASSSSQGSGKGGLSRSATSSLWPTLRIDGIADAATCRELRARITEISTTLTKLGRKVPTEPIRSQYEFRAAIKAFQESIHVAAMGSWNEETAVSAQMLLDANNSEKSAAAAKPVDRRAFTS